MDKYLTADVWSIVLEKLSLASIVNVWLCSKSTQSHLSGIPNFIGSLRCIRHDQPMGFGMIKTLQNVTIFETTLARNAKDVPPTVKSLVWRFKDVLTNEHLEQLPRSITSLRIRLGDHNISQAGILALPQTLI
jgi:hypothetical protein